MKDIINSVKSLFDKKGINPALLVANPLLTKNLHMLENRFDGAVHFLKNTSIKHHGKSMKLNHIPWYLLIGSTGCGKTTLLANSNINFILDKQFKKETIQSLPRSEACDWWVMRDLVLIDVPGSYIAPKEKSVASASKLWHHFLTLIQKHRGKEGIGGVVIALSLSELMDKENRSKLIQNLRYRISELKAKFGADLPFYFTMTKCDLLPGFSDFFSDCGQDELSQAWGITIPPLSEEEELADIFSVRFDALIARLNKQLIWRLHQERNPYAKLYIKDFPLQVERLKEAFFNVLCEFKKEKIDFCLKGVYLTSAIQHPDTLQMPAYPQVVSADEFQQALRIMHAPTMPSHAYFVKQFIMQALLPTHRREPNPINWQALPKRYSVAASVFFLAAAFVGYQFFHGESKDQPVVMLAQNTLSPKQMENQTMNVHEAISPWLAQQAVNFSPIKLSN